MAEKLRRIRFPFDLGTIIFLVIVIYITAYSISYMTKDKLAIYEVSESDIMDTIKGTGVILREEMVINTKQEGYINYYVKDGSCVKNKGTVYTIDTTGKIQTYLNKVLKEKNNVSDEEKQQIFEDLKSFSESYDDNDFSEVYQAKRDINHDLMSYTDTILASNKESLEKEYGANCYVEVPAEISGLVSFSSDGLENLTEKKVSKKIFRQKSKMKDLRSNTATSANSPVYRMTTSQNWKLMIPIDKNEYNRLQQLEKQSKTEIQVTFHKDNFETTAPFQCVNKKNGYYLILSFDNFVQRYLNQRYLDVELLLSETDGLKIPSSSLVRKSVYKIPESFLTKEGNSSTKGQVNVVTLDKKTGKKLTQVSISVYGTEGEYAFVATKGLSRGDVLSDADQTKTFTLEDTNEIQGVFIVNKGYAVFEPVYLVERNEDYCIVSAEESSIERYDRIILNSDTIKENQVIY